MKSLQLSLVSYCGKRNRLLVLSLIILGLSGCGTMMQGAVEDMALIKKSDSCAPFLEDNPMPETEKYKLSPGKLTAQIEKFLKLEWGQGTAEGLGDDPISQFLDCVIAPVEPNDIETRLFRGHVVATLLARYGAFNITGEAGKLIDIDFRPYPEMIEDSATLLTHIEIAQDLLRSENKTAFLGDMGEVDSSAKIMQGVPNVMRMYRILGVLEVAIDAERPTYRRTLRAIRSIITAAATKSLGDAKGAFTDALNGVAKVAVLKTFRQAYLADASEAVAKYAKETNIVAKQKFWWQWDLLLN